VATANSGRGATFTHRANSSGGSESAREAGVNSGIYYSARLYEFGEASSLR